MTDPAAWLDSITAAATEDEVFTILSEHEPPTGPLNQQLLRGRLKALLEERFEAFGSSVSPARTADAWLRVDRSESTARQGQGFMVEEIEPWGPSVAGADVLDEVSALFDAYLYAQTRSADALALWTAYSHVFDCFGLSPNLDLSSPTMRCGKSTAVVVAVTCAALR